MKSASSILFELPHAPLHARIKHVLRTRILDGTYAPLAQVPSESMLGAMFGVSRITVRQALASLQKEGLIFTLQGKGSFVSRPKAFQNVSNLMGFGESMSAMGYEVVNQLLDLRFSVAEPYVARRLQLAAGATVAEIRRTRLLNREPVSLEVTYVPEALGRRLATADLVTRDIFLIIENDCGTVLGHADLMIDAALADRELARTLLLDEGAPVLRIERLTHDAQRRPIDFEHLYFRADAFQYRLRIDRQRPSQG
ncbi:MAG TPA: GntR family transcriptional regulator [Steroidobacteraceae bacterium]